MEIEYKKEGLKQEFIAHGKLDQESYALFDSIVKTKYTIGYLHRELFGVAKSSCGLWKVFNKGYFYPTMLQLEN